ncbi:hypothetical protein DSO57_1028013 [Entomophthora muscae]|uniref:Uncharacterized protein n=1 Tax=Entomophthora muscae TaxID=34485 RepID=A0ACC2T1U7_9FUNG|nr:hypothetical protein DSO57_1028013 [Entomophthora muscae]
MFNFAKYLVCAFVFLGHCSSQGLMAKGITIAYNRVDGFGKLLKLIVAWEDLNKKGEIGHEFHPLASPRPDFGITSEDMHYFLPHSVLSLCTAKQVASNGCFCEGNFENAMHFKNESFDSQAVVAADPNRNVIAVSIRMSVTDKNWDSNYRSDLVPHPLLESHQKVHLGHLEYFLTLRRQLVPAVVTMLRNPKYKDYALHISGYSLGASASAISLPYWIKDLKSNSLNNKVQLFTYSGPRPGNLEFAYYLESLGVPIFRYAKKGDVVPHVADQSMGYYQVGQEFFDTSLPILKKSVIKCANNVIEDPNCALSDGKFLATHHLTPFQRPIPIPPYC